MNQENYQRVMRVIDAVIDLTPSRQQAALEEACAGDEDLRREALKLLAHHTAAGAFLEESPFEALQDAEAENNFIGRRLGPYRITEEVGRGGMGAVYKAVRDDDEYRTEVAIKLVKRGMDTDFILRRFRNERQILASLNHPNIARLLGGDTTADGLPYFVMEYIAGRPIDEYCDAQKLETRARLRLFRKVCAAVQYAHQNFVIHRDIKPSNILVTADGEPKLLDFGIAKILRPEGSDEGQEATATVFRLMTPEYASPEQVRGERVTTASDLYSLGVLLYELLTGHRPYRFRNRLPDEVARVICEQEPERPSTAISRVEEAAQTVGTDGESGRKVTAHSVSDTRGGVAPETLRRHLRGDLDTIVLTALKKEPGRRYASVESFSEDIRRHLEGLPVSAHKDTFSYRASKFVRRHKLPVAAAALVLLTLVGGIVATAWQARVARQERARAERRFNDVRRLANSLVFELHDEIDKGGVKAKELLVRRALEYLNSLAPEAGDDAELQRELALSYLKIGDVQGLALTGNLGDTKGALESYQKSVALYEKFGALKSADREVRREWAVSYERLGEMSMVFGKPAEAAEHFRKALSILESLPRDGRDDTLNKSDLAVVHKALGAVLGVPGATHLGDSRGALEHLRKAAEIYESVPAEEVANSRPRIRMAWDNDKRTGLASIYADLSTVLDVLGNTQESLDYMRKSVALSESQMADNPKDAKVRRNYAVLNVNLGGSLLRVGEVAESLVLMRKSLVIYEALAAEDRNNLDAQRDLAQGYRNVGRLLAANKDNAGAIEYNGKALALFQELAKDESNVFMRRQLALTYVRQSMFLLDAAKPDAARDAAGKAVAIGEALTASDPKNATARNTLAMAYSQLGKCHAQLAATHAARRAEHWREAKNSYQRSLDEWLKLRESGALSAADAGKPEEVAREIARCDAAL